MNEDIDTQNLGLVVMFISPSQSRKPETWEVHFDSGIILILPVSVFMRMKFKRKQ